MPLIPPIHCKGCPLWHSAGHPKSHALHGSKYDNWCCKFGQHATKALVHCKNTNSKPDASAKGTV